MSRPNGRIRLPDTSPNVPKCHPEPIPSFSGVAMPADDEAPSDPYLAEMERFCDRLARMECVRTPELLRAASYLLDVFPEFKRLRATSRGA